ncbi:MAG: ACP S-malonyltransferase [Acidimicrobiia bacterium]
MAVAVIFPGQGTQAARMGEPWRDHPAWTVVERAEEALGEPLAPLLLADSPEVLSRTRDSQLAVLLTSLVSWEAARVCLPAPSPVAFAGHSLGQVTALIASGCLSLEDGIRLAAQRAEATQRAADETPGRMAALVGASESQAAEACAAAPGECWIANDNAPGQIVVAGTPSGIERATKAAEAAGVRRVTPLRVGGAFHTPLMAPAAEALAGPLADTTFATPAATVYSNAEAAPCSDPDGWRTRFAAHLVSPVRWRSSMQAMVSDGADAFLEVGFGSTLAALAKRCVPGVPVSSVGTPADAHALMEVA